MNDEHSSISERRKTEQRCKVYCKGFYLAFYSEAAVSWWIKLRLALLRHNDSAVLTVPFGMPRLVSGISFRLLSDNLGPTTLILTHLFLPLPPHPPPLSHHCHHPSLHHCFTPGSKPSCSTNHFHPRLPSPFRTDSMVSCPAPFLLSISVFIF